MTIASFDAALGQQYLGRLDVRGEASSFSFHASYLESGARPVLGLQFEERLKRPSRGFRTLPVWFQNIMPEGQLRSVLCRSHSIDDRQDQLDVDVQLLRVIGHDLPGAISFTEASPSSSADDLAFADLGFLGVGAELSPLSRDLFKFSAAGVGVKFSVDKEEGQFVAPARNASGHWYVKMPHPTLRNLPLNEYQSMTLAGRVGIEVPEFELVHKDNVTDGLRRYWGSESVAYAVRRFDRTESGKIHIEDLAQVRGYASKDKYRGTYETLASYIYRGGDTNSLIEFTRRLVFSVAIGNSDAHLKNWSLIYSNPRKPSIAPAYDLVSIEAYREDNMSQELALSWGGTSDAQRFRMSNFNKLEARLGVEAATLRHVAKETVDRVRTELALDQELFSFDPLLRSKIVARLRNLAEVNDI
jgi:serine/threonine-protein kinase HipA